MNITESCTFFFFTLLYLTLILLEDSYYLTLPLLDSTIIWRFLLLDSTIIWRFLLLDSITWRFLLLDSTITWLFYYLTIPIPITWLYYYLTLQCRSYIGSFSTQTSFDNGNINPLPLEFRPSWACYYPLGYPSPPAQDEPVTFRIIIFFFKGSGIPTTLNLKTAATIASIGGRGDVMHHTPIPPRQSCAHPAPSFAESKGRVRRCQSIICWINFPSQSQHWVKCLRFVLFFGLGCKASQIWWSKRWSSTCENPGGHWASYNGYQPKSSQNSNRSNPEEMYSSSTKTCQQSECFVCQFQCSDLYKLNDVSKNSLAQPVWCHNESAM